MSAARVMILRSTDSYGGAERQIVGFARKFDLSLFHPVIGSFADGIGGKNPFLQVAAGCGLETAVVDADRGFESRGVRHLTQLARDLEIDLLCPQDYRANIYALAASRRLGIPVVATAHGYTGHTLNVKLYEALDKIAVLRYMDAVVCVSEAYRRRFRRLGIPQWKLHLVYNSIEASAAGSSPAKQRASRGVVCSVGRLSIEKGHRYLLDAWPSVLTRAPHARLVLVGDGPERERLVQQAALQGMEESVEFVGFTDRPMDYIASCDVFVLPSLTEGLPVALLEACSAARAVVASDVGGVGEVISGGGGLMVRAGRPDELSGAIIHLLERPDEARSMGEQARKAVEERFSFERNVPMLQEVYAAHLKRKVCAAQR